MEQTSNSVQHTKKRSISIQVSLNGFSFCIHECPKRIVTKSYHRFPVQQTPERLLDKIKSEFETNPELQQVFEEIHVVYDHEMYTFVPSSYFSPTDLRMYLSQTVKVFDTDYISSDPLEGGEMQSIYIPFTNINNYFFDTFGSFDYHHVSTLLVEMLLHKEKYATDVKVYVYVGISFFYIIIINSGRLVLCNTFTYTTKEDFIYYLLFTTQQVSLDPEIFNLILMGYINEESDLYEAAYTYVRNVSFYNTYEHRFQSASDTIQISHHDIIHLLPITSVCE